MKNNNLSEMSIFTNLIIDHDKHRELLDQINSSFNDPKVCTSLFSNFAVEVKAHALAEEQALYGTLMKKPEFTADVRHSVAEHKEIDDLFNEVIKQDQHDDWLIQFRILEKRYLHHIQEEEEELFIKAQKKLSMDEQKNMGDIFEERKPIEKSSATVGEEE